MPCQPEMEPGTSLSHWRIGQASHVGCAREHNEDASLALQFLLVERDEIPSPLGLFVLADGAGGHSQGQQASALACRQAAAYLLRRILLPLLDDTGEYAQRVPINDVLESSVTVAHDTIAHRLPEAATTLTIALALDSSVYIAHVGDSRAYLGNQGRLQCLTQDHSMAARLLEMGQMTAEELGSQRHILYRAVGRGSRIEPDIVYHGLEPGDYLLLCCDGLWGQVSDGEISAIVDATATPDAACQALVARALETGGEDNISVIIAARTWPITNRVASA